MELRRKCAAEAKAFFSLPEAEKAEIAANGRAYGFFPMSSEALGYNADVKNRPDLREAFSMGPPPSSAPPSEKRDEKYREVDDFCYQTTPWPKQGGLQTVMEAYFEETRKLSERLLRVFAKALNVEPSFFLSKCDRHASSLRVIHYPPILAPPLPGQLRCGAHSDICTMTLLWQDVHGGLEVCFRDESEWVPV